MIPLLIPFLLDTLVVPPPQSHDIFVHEWGVVVFSSDGAFVTGAPDEERAFPFGPVLVDAPVVWIHGAPFRDGVFTVTANQGLLTVLHPDPRSEDEYAPDRASWRISSPPPRPMTERPEHPSDVDVPFAWAMDYWRDVPSRDLYSAETGEYLGNFLYYESSIPRWQPPENVHDPMTLAGHYSPEGLAIGTGTEPAVERIRLVLLPDGTGSTGMDGSLEDREVRNILCGWAAGGLKSSEVDALWNTWKPFFQNGSFTSGESADRRGREERWILFPLPPDEVERISSIDLEIHDDGLMQVHYTRFFLGLVRVY